MSKRLRNLHGNHLKPLDQKRPLMAHADTAGAADPRSTDSRTAGVRATGAHVANSSYNSRKRQPKSDAFHSSSASKAARRFGNDLYARALIMVFAVAFLFSGTLAVVSSANNMATAAEDQAVTYVDRTWNASSAQVESSNGTRTSGNYTLVTSGSTEWSGSTTGGWYVATGITQISSRVTVSGDVHLILADDASLTIDGGINVPANSSLTVYGQTAGSGTLTANGGTADSDHMYEAVIGGNQGETAGAITINGGSIEAKGSSAGYYHGAIVGGGSNGGGGTITLNGGSLTATGGSAGHYYGAVVGGGDNGTGGSLQINGGTLTATGGNSSTYPSTVIGHGDSGSDFTVSIAGGTVIVSQGEAESVFNSSPTVSTASTYQWRTSSSGSYTTSTSGQYSYSSTQTYVEITYPTNENNSDTGTTATLSDVIEVLDEEGCTLDTIAVSYTYYTWNESTASLTESDSSIAGNSYCLVTESDTTWGTESTSSWYVVTDVVTISERVTVSGDVSLILTDDASLTAEDGIEVDDGNSFTIYGQTAGIGKLTATSTSDYAAGIGGGYRKDAGSITIHGGSITAQGGQTQRAIGGYLNYYGAGIGGGRSASAGTVTIYGGTISATGGVNSPGIGGAYSNTASGTVTIYGGTITARGSVYTHGIGWDQNPLDLIAIHGGDVTASAGNSGAGIGGTSSSADGGKIVITGGKVTASASGGGAGIGGGYNGGTVDEIIISGGEVTATGSTSGGAGIGGGDRGDGGNITITGGTVNATSGWGSAAIGGGRDATSATITIAGGTVTATARNASNHQSSAFGASSDENTTITISGGTVIAQVRETTTDPAVSFTVAPTLSYPDGYRWRTSSTDEYTSSSTSAYAWDSAHTYVEFVEGAGNPGSGEGDGGDTLLVNLPTTGGTLALDAITLVFLVALLATCVAYYKTRRYRR